MSKFPQRLKELRHEKQLTQDELAVVLNFTRAAISGYEVGRNEPSFSDLNKLADYFDVTVDYLTGRVDYRNNVVKEISPNIKVGINKNHDMTDNELEMALKIVKMIREGKIGKD